MLTTYRDLFTPRQLVALTTFSDLVGEARERVLADGGDETYARRGRDVSRRSPLTELVDTSSNASHVG